MFPAILQWGQLPSPTTGERSRRHCAKRAHCTRTGSLRPVRADGTPVPCGACSAARGCVMMTSPFRRNVLPFHGNPHRFHPACCARGRRREGPALRMRLRGVAAAGAIAIAQWWTRHRAGHDGSRPRVVSALPRRRPAACCRSSSLPRVRIEGDAFGDRRCRAGAARAEAWGPARHGPLAGRSRRSTRCCRHS